MRRFVAFSPPTMAQQKLGPFLSAFERQLKLISGVLGGDLAMCNFTSQIIHSLSRSETTHKETATIRSSLCLFGDETRLFSAFFSLVPSLDLEREIIGSVIHPNPLQTRHCVVVKGVYCSKYAKKASVIPKDK